MRVIDVVREYHLELVNKEYIDVYGQKHNLINLKDLSMLEVKDFYLNLKTNEATMCVLDIEKIDTNKKKEV